MQNWTGVVSLLLRPQRHPESGSSLLHDEVDAVDAVVAPPELRTYSLDDLCIAISSSRPASSVSRSFSRSSSLMTSDHFRFSAVTEATVLRPHLESVFDFDFSFFDGVFLLFSLTFCSLIISFSSSSEE